MSKNILSALRDFHWMARRYCDGRSSTAPSCFNDHVRRLLKDGVELREPLFARDGMGRAYDGLTTAEAAAAEADMPRGAARFLADTEDRTIRALAALNSAPDVNPAKATRAEVAAMHRAIIDAALALSPEPPPSRGEG